MARQQRGSRSSSDLRFLTDTNTPCIKMGTCVTWSHLW